MRHYLILVPVGLVMDQLYQEGTYAAAMPSQRPPHEIPGSAGKRSAPSDVERDGRNRKRSRPSESIINRENVHDDDQDHVVVNLVDDSTDVAIPTIASTDEMEYLVRAYELKHRHWKHLTTVKQLFENKTKRFTSDFKQLFHRSEVLPMSMFQLIGTH